MERGVVHPRPAEKDFTMRGHTVKERAVLGSTFSHAASDETPDIVVVPGHAKFAWLVSGPKSFLMQEQCFFPKGAFGSENADGNHRPACQIRESFGEIGL